jgi:hypothetical protein
MPAADGSAAGQALNERGTVLERSVRTGLGRPRSGLIARSVDCRYRQEGVRVRHGLLGAITSRGRARVE